MYEPKYDPKTGGCLGVIRLSDFASIEEDPANMDWQDFLAWNAAQPTPLDLSDLPLPEPTPSELNAAAIRTFLTNEVEALRTARQNFPDTLTNAQRDQAIKRLAKDVEYMMRILLHAFDHAD